MAGLYFYSEHGHNDFVLCLGYKANTIKEFFLNGRPELYSDYVVTQAGAEVQLLGKPRQDWRIIGLWRNIGERLWAVREQVQDEEMFMANYSDGLAAVSLPEMVETFKRSGKVACFLAVRPSFSLHLVDMTQEVKRIKLSKDADLQRQLRHLPTADLRLHARGRGVGRSAISAPHPGRPVAGRSSRGVLASHGHSQG
jgi:glucose-1-phosphate cytidylyltransferase